MKNLLMTSIVTALLCTTSFAKEAKPAPAPAPAPQLVPVYQMGPNNQVSTYPVFYVLHGQYANGQPMVMTANGAAVAPGQAAGTAAAGATATQVAPAGAASGLSKYLNPGTMINSAVQGAVQGGINRALDN